MRPWTPLLLLAAMAALGGCDSAPSPQCERALQNDQGEDYRCVSAEDCPHPAHLLLCITDTGTNGQPECVRCRNTTCVVTPETC